MSSLIFKPKGRCWGEVLGEYRFDREVSPILGCGHHAPTGSVSRQLRPSSHPAPPCMEKADQEDPP